MDVFGTHKGSKGLKSHTPGFLTPPHYPVPFPASIHRSRNSDPERGRDEGQSIVVPLDGDERKIIVISGQAPTVLLFPR